MVKTHWCSDVSSLANKVLNENTSLKPKIIPLTEDVKTFNTYITTSAQNAFEKLSVKENQVENYKILAECTFALTLVFNRKRIGEVQFLEIETYTRDWSGRVTQQESIDALNSLEKALCTNFKRVVVFGKGSKAVPILFTKQMQMFVEALLEILNTTEIVPKTNKYLFAGPVSKDRWMIGGSVIRKLAKKSGAKNPENLTSTKFRKHIATILQLLNFTKNEIEQLAKFMGHTEKTHMEFYRLPEDIYQTAKVAKVLLLLNAGKGSEFKGQRLEEIELNENEFCVDFKEAGLEDSDEENDDLGGQSLEEEQDNLNCLPTSDIDSQNSNVPKSQKENCVAPAPIKKIGVRISWSDEQKRKILQHFDKHVQEKQLPKKVECISFIATSGDLLKGVDWSRVKTLVYNTYRQK